MSSITTTDPKQACLEYFSSLYPLNSEAWGFLEMHLNVENVSRNTRLIAMGKVNTELYFIHKGLARGHYPDENGKDVTGWLATEPNCIYFPSSFRLQIPAMHNVELLEDSTLVSLPYERLNQLYQLHPEANGIGRIISENHVMYFAERLWTLRSMSAEERYWYFFDRYPNLFGRVQGNYIASFLNMAPETYSRLQSSSIQKTKPR